MRKSGAGERPRIASARGSSEQSVSRAGDLPSGRLSKLKATGGEAQGSVPSSRFRSVGQQTTGAEHGAQEAVGHGKKPSGMRAEASEVRSVDRVHGSVESMRTVAKVSENVFRSQLADKLKEVQRAVEVAQRQHEIQARQAVAKLKDQKKHQKERRLREVIRNKTQTQNGTVSAHSAKAAQHGNSTKAVHVEGKTGAEPANKRPEPRAVAFHDQGVAAPVQEWSHPVSTQAPQQKAACDWWSWLTAGGRCK